jgi:hypothetical protein
MPEPLTESGLGLTLMPAAQQRLLDMSATPSQPISLSELQRFLHLVVCDGRYLDQVVNDPQGVAKKLGLDLSPEAEAQFREKSLDQHLVELCVIKYPAMQLELVIDIVVVVFIAVVVSIAAIYIYDRYHGGERKKPPIDRSAHAHLKL